jgi:hypothetical protein
VHPSSSSFSNSLSAKAFATNVVISLNLGLAIPPVGDEVSALDCAEIDASRLSASCRYASLCYAA